MTDEPILSVFIDEAGDPGVRDGLSFIGQRYEWLCLSAIVVRHVRDQEIVSWVNEMRQAANSHQAGSLHYHRIAKGRRERVCEVLASKPLKAFVLATHKSNMREYTNPRLKSSVDSARFYNWCIRLLLERVTAWCERWHARQRAPIVPLRLILAKRGHDYRHLFAYIDKLRMQAETKTLFLKGPGFNPILLRRMHWSVIPAEQLAGLQLADTVASAFYQAANTISPSHDTAPATALQRVMATNASGCANVGVSVWPLSHQAPVPEDAQSIFRTYGYDFG